MFKVGLKLFSTNTDFYFEDAKRLFEQQLFDYIELYIVPGTLECLKKWRQSAIPFIIHAAHSVHGFNLADESKESSNRLVYKEVKAFADALDARFIIFHGGIDGSIEETARQLKDFDEPRALIENKPMRPLTIATQAKECRGFDAVEIKYVMDETKCGFCLDFGHAICAANALKQEPYSYAKAFCSLNPKVYHLSDILDMSSVYDTHLHLGKGVLNIPRLLTQVPRESYLTIETEKTYSNTLNDFVEDIKWLTCIT
jgi:deoxyribonuclease-4